MKTNKHTGKEGKKSKIEIGMDRYQFQMKEKSNSLQSLEYIDLRFRNEQNFVLLRIDKYLSLSAFISFLSVFFSLLHLFLILTFLFFFKS